jgi:hypothetical protein
MVFLIAGDKLWSSLRLLFFERPNNLSGEGSDGTKSENNNHQQQQRINQGEQWVRLIASALGALTLQGIAP